jgi:hypothetical protein
VLGLIFSPVWAGIMAAVNSRRLKIVGNEWRPLVIALVGWIVSASVATAFADPRFADLVGYLATLAVLWHVDLKPQLAVFRFRIHGGADRAGNWLGPTLTGLPAALIVLSVFCSGPTSSSGSNNAPTTPPSSGQVVEQRTPEPAPVTPAQPVPVAVVENKVVPNAPPLARVEVKWWDGTTELQGFAAQLPEDVQVADGLLAILSNTDVYAAHVSITNAGTMPVRIFPENIHIHFAGEAAGVTTVKHPAFLQACVLAPGERVEGLVAFSARMDIGAAIRSGGGQLSYEDSTIQVNYPQ